MNATLGSIDAAILTALSALHVDRGGKFNTIMRYAGIQGREQEKLVSRIAESVPALMLAFESETFEVAEGSILMGEDSFIGTSIWRVFVVHNELAGYEQAVAGQVDSPGILELVGITVKALSGLAIPNLFQSSRLRPIEVKPMHVMSGEFVYMARFRADRFIDGVPIPDASVPLEGITGDMHLVEADNPPDPIESFQVSIETE